MRFQDRTVIGTFTLPLAALWAVMVSVAAYLFAQGEWASMPALAASTYCMLEMNNHNMLLRKRSRMVSCSFLMLTMMCMGANNHVGISIVQLCFAGAIFLLTFTYQNKKMVGVLFYVALLVGISSFVWIHSIWLMLLLLLVIFRPLSSLSFRGINGMFFGLALPYSIYATYRLWEKDLAWWEPKLQMLTDSRALFDYGNVRIELIPPYVLMWILTVCSTFHFISYSYQDKVRVRMLYWMYIALAWLTLILIACAPCNAHYLLPIACIPVSVLTAHLFTHTSTKFSNISFSIAIILAMLITVFEVFHTFILTLLSTLA